jgi:hypothetical protein
MEQKCHGHECNKPVFENYYCETCFTELQNQKQKGNEKPKINGAKLIHKAMFG